ncbi:TPA: DUF3850 domain-containing protein [Candidatus Woesearchaeota archaeon]|jgi:hypothetical protein|nr:hypothetical protein [archaeon]HIJ10687.1 DUF3850 domain-containing protein [Candidatus Woesearchaeota archaeon]|tara:strand:- start:1106 stop:1372 length:267 start_codon:yes stop_codon:yes gene_type:complete
MRIEKKLWPQYFAKVLSGEKTFELRLADWHCSPGDTIILKEWDSDTKQYTGRVLEKKVGYVAKIKPHMLPFWSEDEVKEHGLQIISLK